MVQVNPMKKFLVTIAIALMAISAYAQKDIPAGASLELASIENNDKQFTLYKVKDLEGNPAFYLTVGRVTGSMSLSIGSFSSESTSLDAATLFIGETYEEAMETLDSLIEMFKEENGAQREFECFGTSPKWLDEGLPLAPLAHGSCRQAEYHACIACA